MRGYGLYDSLERDRSIEVTGTDCRIASPECGADAVTITRIAQPAD
ncbi:hypothetical protein [Natronomonas sp. LN261]|nr:hypothetical protein [Natronomonas sp. LN261]